MIDVEYIHTKHLTHGCIISDNPLYHQGCGLDFRGFLIAIDCDKCKSFSKPGTKKPDLLVLRRHNNHNEWYVIEIKKQLLPRALKKALEQVNSGINIITNHPNLFGKPNTYRLQVLLAFTCRKRVADIGRYRQPFKPDGRPVPLRVRKCDGERI